ncbi:MAG: hypothetical protein IKQ33_01935 [Clostridia bacterium]|nr:hypothetical protein [Clostridia bacterium]
MSKAIKLDNNVYLDSSSIVHNKTKLSDIFNDSTNEVKIGKWIDGKEMYRKVYTCVINGKNANIDTGLQNIFLINATFRISNGATIFDACTYRWDYNDASLKCYVANGKISFESSGMDRTGYTLIAILEYTKTTD